MSIQFDYLVQVNSGISSYQVKSISNLFRFRFGLFSGFGLVSSRHFGPIGSGIGFESLGRGKVSVRL